LIPLAVATAVGSAGLAAGGTAGALVATDIAGSAAAGLPVTALIAGSAAGAVLISWMAARGRRGRGLVAGYALGVLGAVVVVFATVVRDLTLLLAGSAVLGAANASVFLTRYAAVDRGPRSDRGRVLGVVLSATAGGAVLGPLLLGPSGRLAQLVGLPELTGLYLVAVVSFGFSAALFAAAANPRTPWLGRAASVLAYDVPGQRRRAPLLGVLRDRGTAPAFATLAMANFIMVGTMAVAPVHLMTHGHGANVVGIVVALHVAGMFGPAPLAGRLADRFGPVTVVLVGNVLLIIAGFAGALLDQQRAGTVAAGLLILGVGWNFCVVGGSALLVNGAPADLRPQVEGLGEVAMGTAAGIAAPVAGLGLATAGGYPAVALVGGVLAAAALVLIQRWHRSNRREPWRSPRETAHL